MTGGEITFSEPSVINRYLMPIASTTISASNGKAFTILMDIPINVDLLIELT